eukprot:5084523-Amphidinium_carterae.2
MYRGNVYNLHRVAIRCVYHISQFSIGVALLLPIAFLSSNPFHAFEASAATRTKKPAGTSASFKKPAARVEKKEGKKEEKEEQKQDEEEEEVQVCSRSQMNRFKSLHSQGLLPSTVREAYEEVLLCKFTHLCFERPLEHMAS